MATVSQYKARAHGSTAGNNPQLRVYTEELTETFKIGALLFLSSSNRVRAFPTGGATGTGFDSRRKRIVGIAKSNASNAAAIGAAQNIVVEVADADTVFIANAINRNSVATSSLALTDLGKAMTASCNSSRLYVDLAASVASSILRVIKLIDPVGTTYGRVLFQFLPGALVTR